MLHYQGLSYIAEVIRKLSIPSQFAGTTITYWQIISTSRLTCKLIAKKHYSRLPIATSNYSLPIFVM